MVGNDVVVAVSRHRLPSTSQVRAPGCAVRFAENQILPPRTVSGAPGTVDRAVPSGLNGSAKCCASASNVIIRPSFAVRCVLVNSAPVPVAPLVSSLQLTLNLHNFRYIFRRENDLAGQRWGRNPRTKRKTKSRLDSNTQQSGVNGQPKIGKNEYEAEIFKLQVELVKLQDWVKATNARIVIIFEGRDAAGKGGMIKRIVERVSPRIFRVVALPAPTERQKTQLPAQRYIEQLPAGGEVVIFDRSWYNRAGVEYVMGFCTDEEHREFLRDCPIFEGFLVSQGIILLKYWLEVSEKEQHKRFLARIEDPSKRWKLSPMDLESHRRWYDYSRARDAMLAATDTAASPWYIVPSDDKKRAHLNCIAHILSSIPYEEIPYTPPKLPPRQKPKGYVEPKQKHRTVPQVW